MNDLFITWDTGHMNVDMDVFFPCSNAKLNQLRKIIYLDWNHCGDLILQIQTYFEEQIKEMEKQISMCFNDKKQKNLVKTKEKFEKLLENLKKKG